MKRALLVGISEYPDSPLPCAQKDVDALVDVLKMTEYGFECTVLLNEQATTRSLKEKLEYVLAADQVALVYFSGHGAATDYGAYLVSWDTTERGDDGLDLSLVTRMVSARTAPGSSAVIILDCCHSGGLQIGSPAVVSIRSEDLSRFINLSSERRVLLAACQEHEVAYESESLQHGVFTYHLLQGLLGDAANTLGEVTANSVYDHISEQFGAHNGQTPVYRGDLNGRIVLGRGLLSRPARKSADEIDNIARQAMGHARTAQAAFAAVGDHQAWQRSGHRQACKAMASTVQWFRRREREHPMVRKNNDFLSAQQGIAAKLEILARLEPGMSLESGVVTERIGSGSFGTVWKICSHADGSILAGKVYHANELSYKDKVHRFRQGYEAMRKLEHPHIVRVHQLFDCPYMFTMDYVPGANLREWNGATGDLRELMGLLFTIADTLRHAHGRGVIHRDVKPENIVMAFNEGRWVPHLTDFDLAWYSTASLSTKDALGTIYYASPEQLAKPGSASTHSARVDFYSFGMVLYFVLTGSDPVPMGMADNTKALAERLRQWGSRDAAVRILELYKSCSEIDPEKRPHSMDAICGQLTAISGLLRSGSRRAVLSLSDFVSELRYGISGSLDERVGTAFSSSSHLTHVACRHDGDVLSMEFTIYRVPLVDNVKESQKAKETIRQRVHGLLKQWRGYQFVSGVADPFSVNIRIPMTELAAAHIQKVQEFARQMISEVERG